MSKYIYSLLLDSLKYDLEKKKKEVCDMWPNKTMLKKCITNILLKRNKPKRKKSLM